MLVSIAYTKLVMLQKIWF